MYLNEVEKSLLKQLVNQQIRDLEQETNQQEKTTSRMFELLKSLSQKLSKKEDQTSPHYQIKLTPVSEEGDSGWWAEHPEILGFYSYGDTLDEAIHKLNASKETWIAYAKEHGLPIIEPRGKSYWIENTYEDDWTFKENKKTCRFCDQPAHPLWIWDCSFHHGLADCLFHCHWKGEGDFETFFRKWLAETPTENQIKIYRDYWVGEIAKHGNIYLEEIAKKYPGIQINLGMPYINKTIQVSYFIAQLRDGITIDEFCKVYRLNHDRVTEALDYICEVLQPKFPW
ncbi:type II toxin-antitoxin system HicB family antitoxin [Shimazuella sp. AN120528]|uniref:type II toxin-antitoxin system HicB family antitoxin n=1 Tax=Shimazuella soli TaxID=1892854 RepID=UPI001F0D03D3|nr:type II toxin-antitoxin system HicB family antitoxin [Shimazuella soli]MCH5583792.1 type II toxin-antitoxin system HicB family antitoxin [Shimazuella soli]